MVQRGTFFGRGTLVQPLLQTDAFCGVTKETLTPYFVTSFAEQGLEPEFLK